MRHLLSTKDLSRDDAIALLDVAEDMAAVQEREMKKLPTLRGKTVVNLFFEDSTRTRISFEAAAKRLSADVINFSAKGSSVSKGESLKDTAQTLQAMGADGVVIRHHASGAPLTLATSGWIDAGVVNAGDGTHEHPTQALLDAFTIRRRLHGAASRGRGLDGVHVVIVGDILHSRVARSNVWLLTTLGAAVELVAPPTLVPVDTTGWPARVGYDLDASLADASRRRHDAPHPGRAHARRVLPEQPRVRPHLGTRRRPVRPAAPDYDGDAPRTDEPRAGDRRPRRRFAAVHGARAGRERSISENGRPLSAAVGRTG